MRKAGVVHIGTAVKTLFGLLVVAFLVVPTFIVIPMSFNPSPILEFPPTGFTLQWYEQIFTDLMWTRSLRNSLTIALLTTVFSTVLGTLAAYGVAYGAIPGKRIVNVMMISPLIVPVVMVAIGMYMVYIQWKPVGNLARMVIAHTALSIPFVFVTVTTSLRSIDRNLEAAARGLGARQWQAFQRITFPLALPGIAAGALFAFITSWDEVVAALFLTNARFQTLPVQMWSQLSERVDPTVAAVSTLLLVVTTLLSVIALIVRK